MQTRWSLGHLHPHTCIATFPVYTSSQMTVQLKSNSERGFTYAVKYSTPQWLLMLPPPLTLQSCVLPFTQTVWSLSDCVEPQSPTRMYTNHTYKLPLRWYEVENFVYRIYFRVQTVWSLGDTQIHNTQPSLTCFSLSSNFIVHNITSVNLMSLHWYRF